MNTPSFQEDHISQVPALQLLQNLGYGAPVDTMRHKWYSSINKPATPLVRSAHQGGCSFFQEGLRVTITQPPLTRRLCCDYGRRFSATNLWNMKRFHGVFEILQTVSGESEPNNAESRKVNGC
jgi:hypothetical protein